MILPMRLEPLTRSACSNEATLALVEKLVSEPVKSRRGRAVTVPVAATVRPVAPAAETATSPETGPGAADAATRTEIVLETEPPDGASETLEAKVRPLSET